MADQIAARSIRASLAQTGLARIVQHRQGTGPDLCARYRLHRMVWAERGATIQIAPRARKVPQAIVKLTDPKYFNGRALSRPLMRQSRPNLGKEP
ncbi:hypothetical protein [Novosphingobium sp.]|uniref:hypothetical protein n=1 Tax=Novosphingobium sp. TaxID=1874826 RepID=UPI0025D3489C|nr:hypothetical protein [Novosphingobium sp.]